MESMNEPWFAPRFMPMSRVSVSVNPRGALPLGSSARFGAERSPPSISEVVMRVASGFRAPFGTEASDPSVSVPLLSGRHLRDQRAPARGEQPTLLRERDLLATPRP